MKNKKSFIMYTDYQKHINRLSDEEAGRLIKAVLEYTNTSIEPELSPAADMAFSFIKEQIDRDLEKWEDTCQKRSEAGKLGGRPRIRKDPDLAQDSNPESNIEPKQSKAKKAIGFLENQTKAKKADNDTVNVSEYVNETENDIDNVSEYVSENENKNDIDNVSEYVSDAIDEFEEIYDPFTDIADNNNNNTYTTDCTRQNKNLYSKNNTDYTDNTDCTKNINNNNIYSTDITDNTSYTDDAYRKECVEQCLQNSLDNMNKFYEMQAEKKKLEPAREEVLAFAETHNAVEYADKFYGYYSRHGWQTKSGEKISDWREAFLRWKQREKPMNSLQNSMQNNMQNIIQNTIKSIPEEYSSLTFSEPPFPSKSDTYSDSYSDSCSDYYSGDSTVISESSKQKALDLLNSYVI